MTIMSNYVLISAETEMDPTTAEYYCPIADVYLWENGYVTQHQASSNATSPCGGGTVSMMVQTSLNTSYELQTNHWLVDNWGAYQDPQHTVLLYDIDELDYSMVSPQGFTGEGTVTAPGGTPINESIAGFLEFYIATFRRKIGLAERDR